MVLSNFTPSKLTDQTLRAHGEPMVYQVDYYNDVITIEVIYTDTKTKFELQLANINCLTSLLEHYSVILPHHTSLSYRLIITLGRQ